MRWSTLIADYRRQQRMTQVDLALVLGVSQATVARWENGWFQPGRDLQARLTALIGGSDDPTDRFTLNRVEQSQFPNLIFTRAGEYQVMSESAEGMLCALHEDAGPEASNYQFRHFTDNMRLATEAGFFAGQVESLRILRRWLTASGDLLGYIRIVWTPIRMGNGAILVESNFQRAGTDEVEAGLGPKVAPFRAAPRPRFVHGIVLPASGHRDQPAPVA